MEVREPTFGYGIELLVGVVGAMHALSRIVNFAVSAQRPRLCAQGCISLLSMPTCAICDVFRRVSCMAINFGSLLVEFHVYVGYSYSVRRRDIPFRRHHHIIFRIILSCRARRS
jgi:hypothetical protein